MNGMEAIVENVMIDRWARFFSAPRNRVNRPHEADAELVTSPAFPGKLLAITIDTVAEEIYQGIYRDPFTAGWVSVAASISDLAAVGADPLGLVMAVTLNPTAGDEFNARVAQGMEQACQAAGTAILGGDTNLGDRIELTGCAIGLVPEDRVLKRFGCAAGDSLYVSGPVGAGNALGLIRLAGLPDKLFPEELYRPASRLAQGRLLRECASCCMDSSDGLLATLDQLMRINDTGLSIECPWEELVAPPALRLCQSTGTPAWSMAAGPHGEFELVAAVPPAKEAAFRSAVQVQGMSFTRIGTVKKEAGLLFRLRSGEQVPVDAAPFRNLLFAVGTDMRRYLREFLAIGAAMKLDR